MSTDYDDRLYFSKNSKIILMCIWILKSDYRFFFLLNGSFGGTGFPDSSLGKESTCNAGGPGSIPGLGRCPGEGKGYPLQYSGLENSMDCIVDGVAKSWTQLSNLHLNSAIHAIYFFNIIVCQAPLSMGFSRQEYWSG